MCRKFIYLFFLLHVVIVILDVTIDFTTGHLESPITV